MNRICPLVLLVASGLLAGCTTNGNVRMSLDHGLVLEGVNPGRASRIEPLERVPAGSNSIRPVATTLDRSGWEPRRVLSPAGGVRNRPSYTHQWMPAYTDRAAGLAPTLVSALDRGDAAVELGFAEGVSSFAMSVFDAIALVPRELFVDPIWEMNESPEWGYERRAMRPWIPLAVAPGVDEESVGREVGRESVPGRIDRIVPLPEPIVEVEEPEPIVEAIEEPESVDESSDENGEGDVEPGDPVGAGDDDSDDGDTTDDED